MKVAICIITYQRPEGLAFLLEAIGDQTFEKNPRPDLVVIVVDNDKAQSAQITCEQVRKKTGLTIVYDVEPQQSIPTARNTSVRLGAGADYFVFIDDDEWPEPTWLDELLFVQASTSADVVTGPVLAHFVGQPPKWLVDGQFIHPDRKLNTGDRLFTAATGNTLVAHHVFSRVGMEPFDTSSDLTGGTDVELFKRVSNLGFRIVWANDARAYEWIPESRQTLSWVLMRAYRVGNVQGFDIRRNSTSILQIARESALGIWIILNGVVRLPLMVFRGFVQVVSSLRMIFRGAGKITGLLNIRYQEYRKIHKVEPAGTGKGTI